MKVAIHQNLCSVRFSNKSALWKMTMACPLKDEIPGLKISTDSILLVSAIWYKTPSVILQIWLSIHDGKCSGIPLQWLQARQEIQIPATYLRRHDQKQYQNNAFTTKDQTKKITSQHRRFPQSGGLPATTLYDHPAPIATISIPAKDKSPWKPHQTTASP